RRTAALPVPGRAAPGGLRRYAARVGGARIPGSIPGMRTRREVARAETVGSLLRPDWLQAARRELAEGKTNRERVRELEDAAVVEAIELQKSAGLDVVTDGEMRRSAWSVTTQTLSGFELRPG